MEYAFPVGAAGFGGAVRVEDQLPAPAVDAHIVMKLAYGYAVLYGGLAAVGFVP